MKPLFEIIDATTLALHAYCATRETAERVLRAAQNSTAISKYCMVLDNQYHYAIVNECAATHQLGCFIHNGDLVSLGPIHQSATALLSWMEANGFELVVGDYGRCRRTIAVTA